MSDVIPPPGGLARRRADRDRLDAGLERAPMIVELLYIEGCPSYERLLPTVRRVAAEAGAELAQRRIDGPAAARALRFPGSPTVRVDGRDIEPGAAEPSEAGLTCRIYRAPGCRQSGLPLEDWLRAALEAGGV